MNKFLIKINFKKVSYKNKEVKNITYYESKIKTYKDKCVFNGEIIEISGSRTTNINKESMETMNSTIYRTVIKSLLYTYFTLGSFEIENICVKVGREKNNYYNLIQNFKISLEEKYKKIDVEKLFDDSLAKSNLVMEALMHIMQSILYEKEFRFDNLWKCFNCLITKFSNKKTEQDKLKAIKESIDKHPNLYKNILDYAQTVDENYLNNRWITGMLVNNITNKTNLMNLVTSFNDYRVISNLKKNINCLKKVMSEQELSYCKNELECKTKKQKDGDIARFLILKYAYFLRNKYFHAERIPTYFIVENRSHKELNEISEPLLLICIDLINNSNHFSNL